MTKIFSLKSATNLFIDFKHYICKAFRDIIDVRRIFINPEYYDYYLIAHLGATNISLISAEGITNYSLIFTIISVKY